MTFVSWKTIDLTFKVCCTLATIFMVGFWILKFQKNEDVSVFEYKEINEFEDLVYPEVSLCLMNPFLIDKIKEIDNNASLNKYVEYLKGIQSIDEIYQEIDFNNVTLDLFEYLTHYHIQMIDGNESKMYDISRNCLGKKKCPLVKFKNNFNGFWRGTFFRCFGAEIEKQFATKIKQLALIFKDSLASPIIKIQEANALQGVVSVKFNYPQQMLKGSEVLKYIWKKPNESRVHNMFQITSMEVLKRRNKENSPCLLDWMHFDDTVLKKHLKEVGCSAPYLNSGKPPCITKEKMSESLYEMTKVKSKHSLQPCQEMSDIRYTFEIVEPQNISQLNVTTPLNVWVDFPNRIKVITQSQSIDVQALIGNIGGYLGLFLGKILL